MEDHVIWVVRVTCNGQITIPAELRRKHNISKGDHVLLSEIEYGQLMLRHLMTIDELEGSVRALDRDDVDDDFGNIIREAREEETERIVAELNDACEKAAP